MSAKESLSPQFVDVYHSSYDVSAPHYSYGRDHIFAGTEQSALERKDGEYDRRYVHQYRIPVNMIRPEIWADDDFDPDSWSHHKVMKLADERGPTLWETIPVAPWGIQPGEVFQYRNHHEDPGSISYVMHKRDIGHINSEKIRYMGFVDRKNPLDMGED